MARAADSGTALRCAITSFLASARAKPGARPLARMPAMPPFTTLRRRMADRFRLLIFMIVDMARPPRRFRYENPIRPAADREASPSVIARGGYPARDDSLSVIARRWRCAGLAMN